MNNTKFKIYCAGPLFNDVEKSEMENIATTLRKSGFSVFLPHKDGIELAAYKEWQKAQSKLLAKNIDKAIFYLDTYLVAEWCDGIVINLNGRVPDEGAVVEAAIAWAHEKAVVAYKNDSRCLLQSGDNPLLSGLANFKTVGDINNIPVAMNTALTHNSININKSLSNGKSIYDCVVNNDYEESRFLKLENLLNEIFSE
jgi:nucleoside 2-deoxyribosyltransferase